MDWDEVLEGLSILGICLIVFVVVIFITLGLISVVDRAECIKTAEILKMEWQHKFPANCLVNTPEYGWFLLDNYILPAGIEP